MSPFKEPQPRKTPIQEEHEAKQKGVFPPYARLGNEARWGEPSLTDPVVKAQEKTAEQQQQQRTANEYYSQPIMVVPDHTPFELRKAALEAACAMGVEPNHHDLFWDNLNTFEAYLRDGTKPS